MVLTAKQEEGLKITVERYRNGEKYTTIAGYAGTGKSELVRFIIAALPNIRPEQVVYCAFTGKATQVLSRKGNDNCITLHKLLYNSRQTPNGSFVRVPKPFLEYKIIIVDECSMVPQSMVELLLKHSNIYVIFIGDPFQLPPVDKNEANTLLENAHVFLNEIMRQEQESEIIRLTMRIREGQPFEEEFKRGQEVQIFNHGELNSGMLIWADQVLVATNKTRVDINNQMRQILGKEGGPQDGDKIVCLHNYWETLSDDETPLINGTIGYLQNSFNDFVIIPAWATMNHQEQQVDLIRGNFISDIDETYTNLSMDKKLIITAEKALDPRVEYKLNKSKKNGWQVPMEFAYGYAITTHKAQGSQWRKVLVFEEKFPFAKEEHARWLYTACTRAESKLVLVR